MATNMTFVDFETPVPADWLNNVNTVVNTTTAFPVVVSINALRNVTKTNHSTVFVAGYYSIGDGGGGNYYLNLADTTSVDNGGTIIVANDGGRWYLQWFGEVSVLQFGVKADNGVTDNSTLLANCQAWVASGTVRNKLVFPAGKYGYTVSPNWAMQNATIVGDGEVHLVYTGTGNAVILDGVAAPNLGVYDMTMTGFIVDSVTTAQNGVFVSYCHHGKFKFKVRGAGASSAGIKTSFCVCSSFEECEVSPNADGGWFGGATPLYGFWVTGPSNILQTSYSTFTNIIAEGLVTTNGAGIFIEASLGNSFFGGTSEGSYTGILSASAANGCVSNKFWGIDCEANIHNDIFDQGFQNEYHSCDTNFQITIVGNALRTRFFGGQHQSIQVATGAQYCGFFGVVWNRNGGGSFAIGDFSTQIRDCVDHANNVPGPFFQTSAAVGASPWTYTNNHGRDQILSLSSGTISQIQLIRSGTGTLIAPTTGFYPLSPGDQLQITYSVAPSVWVYDK